MGVYIKGMEMPESGTYEVSIDSTNGKDKTVMSLFVRGEGGVICCGAYELVHVPPHGRPIDADALIDKVIAKYLKFEREGKLVFAAVEIKQDICDLISDAPTIIEAEEE